MSYAGYIFAFLAAFFFVGCATGKSGEILFYARAGERAVECMNDAENGILLDNKRIFLGNDADATLKSLYNVRFKDVVTASLKEGFKLYKTSRKMSSQGGGAVHSQTLTIVADKKNKIVSIGLSESFGSFCSSPIILTKGFCREVMKEGRIAENPAQSSDKNYSFIYAGERRGLYIVKNSLHFVEQNIASCELDIADFKEALKRK